MVNIVIILLYICAEAQVLVVIIYCETPKFAENAQLHAMLAEVKPS